MLFCQVCLAEMDYQDHKVCQVQKGNEDVEVGEH